MADLCADEILRTLRALWARLPVPVDAATVAERIGAPVASVAQRLARLARTGVLVREHGLYREVCP